MLRHIDARGQRSRAMTTGPFIEAIDAIGAIDVSDSRSSSDFSSVASRYGDSLV
ncbi:hypothetical protein [Leifsonia sp. RAF41]|uniref:hypothetical protein n=1 Tax=Leifsonia sp. RAF41 TaxID=3233056 RepID=UPI003F99BF59